MFSIPLVEPALCRRNRRFILRCYWCCTAFQFLQCFDTIVTRRARRVYGVPNGAIRSRTLCKPCLSVCFSSKTCACHQRSLPHFVLACSRLQALHTRHSDICDNSSAAIVGVSHNARSRPQYVHSSVRLWICTVSIFCVQPPGPRKGGCLMGVKAASEQPCLRLLIPLVAAQPPCQSRHVPVHLCPLAHVR